MAWDYGPIPIIEDARDKSDWFKAVVFSAIQLERHGYFAIKEYFESLNVDAKLIDIILKRIHLFQIAEYLSTIGKIDSEEYRAIIDINEERNKFMHRRQTKNFARGTHADRKYKPLVNEAIRILKEKFNVVRLHVSKG
ncbi:hypothetical protein KAU55_07790 [Candidatus Bathyarchaeota archaeon]|nr:hypothetical protein [Candidatus Bathyarchaeota archaeon]